MLTIYDVSQWQGEINWARVARDPIAAVIIKATEGATFVDPRFEENRIGAEAVGLRVGFYHFADPTGSSPEAQADHHAKVIGTYRRRELRSALDLETGNAATLEPFARSFNRRIMRGGHPIPLFYSYSAFIEEMRLRQPIGAGLWLASYGRDDGKDYGAAVPKPWRKFVAHQFTSHGSAAGIAGAVDVSHAARLTPLLAHPVTGRK